MGGYLTYKFGRWLYERIAYGDKKEEEIPLSPFPIANPVVYHFHPVSFVQQMRRMGDQYKDVSLANVVTFYGYKKTDKKGCYRRCQDMLGSVGFKSVAFSDKSIVQMTKYKSEVEQVLIIQKDIKKGIDIIHKHLDNGIPIVVGIDHSLGNTGNIDKTTDHWILIVGRKTSTNGVLFLFFDPQTSHKSIGTSRENKLVIHKDYTLQGKYRDKNYTVTVVRPSVKK